MSCHFSFSHLYDAVVAGRTEEVLFGSFCIGIDHVRTTKLCQSYTALELACVRERVDILEKLLHRCYANSSELPQVVNSLLKMACLEGKYRSAELLTSEFNARAEFTEIDYATMSKLGCFRALAAVFNARNELDSHTVKMVLDSALVHENYNLHLLGDKFMKHKAVREWIGRKHPVFEDILNIRFSSLKARVEKMGRPWLRMCSSSHDNTLHVLKLISKLGDPLFFGQVFELARQSVSDIAVMAEQCCDFAAEAGQLAIIELCLERRWVGDAYSDRWQKRLVNAIIFERVPVAMFLLRKFQDSISSVEDRAHSMIRILTQNNDVNTLRSLLDLMPDLVKELDRVAGQCLTTLNPEMIDLLREKINNWQPPHIVYHPNIVILERFYRIVNSGVFFGKFYSRRNQRYVLHVSSPGWPVSKGSKEGICRESFKDSLSDENICQLDYLSRCEVVDFPFRNVIESDLSLLMRAFECLDGCQLIWPALIRFIVLHFAGKGQSLIQRLDQHGIQIRDLPAMLTKSYERHYARYRSTSHRSARCRICINGQKYVQKVAPIKSLQTLAKDAIRTSIWRSGSSLGNRTKFYSLYKDGLLPESLVEFIIHRGEGMHLIEKKNTFNDRPRPTYRDLAGYAYRGLPNYAGDDGNGNNDFDNGDDDDDDDDDGGACGELQEVPFGLTNEADVVLNLFPMDMMREEAVLNGREAEHDPDYLVYLHRRAGMHPQRNLSSDDERLLHFFDDEDLRREEELLNLYLIQPDLFARAQSNRRRRPRRRRVENPPASSPGEGGLSVSPDHEFRRRFVHYRIPELMGNSSSESSESDLEQT